MIRDIFDQFSPHVAGSLALLLAGCGEPAPQIDRDPPQLFTAAKRTRDKAPTGSPPADADYTRRVLFIGNSYTQVGDLPGLVGQLVKSSHRGAIEIERNLQGGGTLEVHYMRPGVLEAIRDGDFTHVVLQGQSLEVMDEPDKFQIYAELFSQAILDAGAIPVFFETWARPAGDPVYAEEGYGDDPRGMQSIIRDAYQRAAIEGNGLFAPVGDAWERALAAPNPPDLYGPDIGHPGNAGVYLSACVLYDVLMNRLSTGNANVGPVDAATARRLQQAADATMLAQ